ncbi:MAG: putative DNA-binding transcriptional regulator YafY [Chitinophagales bacterium]|jgi:predicted DNA-binding transcriptional regulator YafY
MPVNKEAFLRYRIIDRLIRNNARPYPSMDDLMDDLEEKLGKSFSVSTIQKDIKSMKEDELLGYKAPIKFHRAHQGYYYADPNFSITEVPLGEEDLDAIEFAAMVLQQFKDVKLFAEFGSAVDKIFNAVNVSSILSEDEVEQMIHFEKVPYYKGSEWIAPILEYIKNRKSLSLAYKRFEADEARIHLIHPILLKEYRNRWYVLGMLEKNNHLVIYALDRVVSCEEGEIAYRHHHQFSSQTYFQYAYGITTFEDEPSELIFQCSPLQAKYLKTQPLHHTQKLLEENDKEARFSLKVGVTPELIMDLLSYGHQVKVLEPKFLKDELIKRLKLAIEQYK